MRSATLSLCLILVRLLALGQQNYDASLIPKELIPYASAVIRNQEVNIEVKDLDNVLYHEKTAITVLNKNGDKIAHMAVFYDKNSVVKNIKGSVFNEFGKLMGKFGEGDFADESVSTSSLFQDDRVKHYIPAITQYPYTIEYEYEIKHKQTLYFPDWYPNPETGLAVEKSIYKFTCKPDFNIRYKELNLSDKVAISTAPGSKTYTWQIANMRAVKDEPFSPGYRKILSRVMIAPEKFSYGNVMGAFTNWQEMGKWLQDKLLYKRDIIPEETIAHVRAITANIPDPKLKAKKVYEYMQQKTHYISVQVGIGGFQPFLASDVDNLGYGDCKALVNYTKALLKAVDIESYYCVVYGNHSEKISLLSDFASIQGNHIILCLPFKNDTTWADCTSQTIPFGFLGDFTDDRTVLACTPQGGKLLHTPKFTALDNAKKRKANFVINDTGELSGTMMSTFNGTEYDDRDGVIEEAPVERTKDVKHIYPINNLEVEKLEYKQDKSLQPVTTENIKLSARDYASVNDDKLVFMLNPVNRIALPPHQVMNRHNDVAINRGYTDEDEITYTLPKGYHLDIEPLNVSIEKPFGNFTAVMTLTGDQLVYKRKMQLIDGTYGKDTYADLVDFYQAVVDADDYDVRLVKNKAN